MACNVNDPAFWENLMLDKAHSDGKCGDDLYWKLVDDRLYIFGTGELESWAWRDCFQKNFAVVCIQPGCTRIGNHAFDASFAHVEKWDHDDWTAKELPKLLSDYWAFEPQLERVYIPDTVKEIGNGAFGECGKLKTFDFDAVEKIGHNAFRKSGLEEVCILDNVKKIGRKAFWGCRHLHGITIGMKEIDDGAFWHLDSLRRVTINEGVKKIGSRAFAGEYRDLLIEIPDSVEEIGEYAFWGIADIRYSGPAQSENMWGARRLNGEVISLARDEEDSESEWYVPDEADAEPENTEDLELPEYDY